MKKHFLSILGICALVLAQAQSEKDSVISRYRTAEVEVVSDVDIVRGRTLLSLHENPLFLSEDFSGYLDRKGIAQVNSNGAAGAASTVRFRGTSSDHTVIYWQGLPINSVSLGMADISMIPVFLFETGSLFPTPDASSFPSSNFGAALSLSDNLGIRDSSFVKLFSSYNSLNNSFSGADISLEIFPTNRSGETKGVLRWRTKTFYQNLRNDFSYHDKYQIEKPVIRQEHNDGFNTGLTQQVSWSWDNKVLEGNLWYQNRKVELPGIMGRSVPGTSEQDDEFLRSVISFKEYRQKWSWSTSTAWLDEFQYFRDMPQSDGTWAIDSKLRSRSVLNTLKSKIQLLRGWELNVNMLSSYYHVDNVNYLDNVRKLWWGELATSSVYEYNGHFFRADIRQELRDIKTQPAWTLGYTLKKDIGPLRLIPDVQVGRRFRTPDFNERFWVPGGREDLLPENGMSYKFSMGVYSSSKKMLSANTVPSIYYSDIQDWIQWVPGNSGYWSPVNFKHVRSYGFEIPLELRYIFSQEFSVTADARYIHTRALSVNQNEWDDALAFHMTYTPEQVVASGLKLGWNNLGFNFYHKYTSLRYTDEQNNLRRALKPYSIAGAYVGYSVKLKTLNLDLGVGIDNLFDKEYESVRSYAMPGRVFQMNLQIQFNILKKQNQ